MPRRPIIGVPTQTQPEEPGHLPACWIMSHRYVDVLRSAGALPWLIPLLHDMEALREIFDRLDGLFLTGGVDVDPSTYGEERLPFCGRTDPDRDRVELQFIKWAIEEKKPILAVCRGIQAINVACGGTLYQDVAAQVPGTIRHDYFPTKDDPRRNRLIHHVEVPRQTRLQSILGSTAPVVNSMHHQAIKTLAPNLEVNAISPDGLIEGVEGKNGQFMIAVQWHPEELTDSDPGMKRLFHEFISVSQS